MAVSLKSLIARAVAVAASTGTDAHDSPAVDSRYVAEVLFPHALRSAIIKSAARGETAGHLKRSFTMTLSSGAAVLPDEIIKECLDHSNIRSEADADVGQLSSFQARYLDFLRPAHSQLGYYTVNGTSFEYRPPNGSHGTFAGDIILDAVAMPEKPATATAAIDISDEVAERTVELLAIMIKGGVTIEDAG
jgi:hypothetical protein